MISLGGTRGVWVAAAITVLFSCLLVARFPVYYRGDDVYFLQWMDTHPNPLWVFKPYSGLHAFRPATSLAWWALYRLFGLNPLPYQILLTVAYGLSIVAFHRLARHLVGPRAAAFSLVAYATLFYGMVQIVFWFSDLSFALEMLFLCVGLSFLVRWACGAGTLLPGLAFSLLAALAKEASFLLVPLLFGGALYGGWHNVPGSRRRSAALLAVILLAAGAFAVFFHPTIGSRATVDLAAGPAAFAKQWRFYATQLFAGPGLLLLVALLHLGIGSCLPSRRWSFWASFLPAAGIALALRHRPEAALVLAFASFLPIGLRRSRRLTAAAAWVAVPLAGVMTSEYLAHAYLFEAAFGASLLAGVFLDEVFGLWRRGVGGKSRPLRAVLAGGAAVALIGGGLVFARKLETKLAALDALSGSRRNARALIERFAERHAGEGTPLVVVDYSDMAMDYVRDIFPLSDVTKARTQKTLVSTGVEGILRLMGKNVLVRDLRWFSESDDVSRAYLFVMSEVEHERIMEAPYELREVFAVRSNDQMAWLFEIVKD